MHTLDRQSATLTGEEGDSVYALSLAGNPAELANGEVKIKLFFESGAEDDYAELFASIDLRGRRLSINEKDPEYRRGVVRALRAEG
jgi:hypothetical protein